MWNDDSDQTEWAVTEAGVTPPAPRFLQIQGLAKAYVPARPVFADVSFDIGRGEFVCIIGHSGCGKTTILNVLAGLDTASSGHVFMDGREVLGPGLERGVVFQSHALMPWLTVRQNIAFAVKSRWPEWPTPKVRVHVERFVAMVGLMPAIDKKPSQLSGGMKQRVGIARAFSIQPKKLLLDERLWRARCAHKRHNPGRADGHRAPDAADGVQDHPRCGRSHPAGRPHPAHEERL